MIEPSLPIPFLALLIAASIIATGVSAAAQAALGHVNRGRFRKLLEEGLPSSGGIDRVLEDPSAVVSISLTLSALGVTAGVVCAWLLGTAVDPVIGSWLSPLIAVVALLAAQVVGRACAIARPEGTATVLLRPLHALGILLSPLVAPARWAERAMVSRLTANRPQGSEAAAEEEIRRLVESVEDTTALEEGEREMITGIVELGDRLAREVMIPRLDVVAAPESASVGQVIDAIVESGFSRVPIFKESIDNVVGIVYAKDILKHLRGGSSDDPVRDLARPPKFVPETKKVDGLLEELQQSRVHMAIVVDEYGGTAGLLTIEDLLEEIVGEIRDEHDVNETLLLIPISETEAEVDGRAPIRDVNELLDVHLDVEEFDTVGGLVYHELGKMPEVGDDIRVDGCRMTVLETQGRRVRKLKITRVEPAESEPMAPATTQTA
ncbi:MAG: hemolysin family protein [Chloroflexota bacterium]